MNHIQSCLSIFLFLCHSCNLSLVHLTTGVSLGLDEGVIGVLLEGLSGTIKGPADGEKLG